MFSSDQLDNLLAPVALYPDPLLAQVLIAATFPEQIDDAARFVRADSNPADIDDRRADQPWYRTKTEPAFEDMLIKLRRTLIAARFSGTRPAQPADDQIRAVLAAWDAAAA